LKLKEIFGAADINDLPIAFNIAWYEQKAVMSCWHCYLSG
jgi:hydroxylamine reductase